MSFPSITKILANRGITDVRTVSPQIQEEVLLEALKTDLPLGIQFLHDMAHEAKTKPSGRVLKVEDPKSKLGQQLIRLIGTDMSRAVIQKHVLHGCSVGLYNCCSPVVATTPDKLQLSLAEQIELQNGVLAHADC